MINVLYNVRKMWISFIKFIFKNIVTCSIVTVILAVMTIICFYILPAYKIFWGILFLLSVFCFGAFLVIYVFKELCAQIKSGKAKKVQYEVLFNSEPVALARNFVLFVVLILFLPLLFTLPALFDSFAFNETGPIGDTIGGIMGPFIAILAAWLTYKAFVMQYEANQNIKESSEKSRFETNFFQLLNLQQIITQDLILYTEVIDENAFRNNQSVQQSLKHVKLRGREAIRQIYDKGTAESKLKIGSIYINYGGVLHNIDTAGYNYMAENDDLSFLDHYFRHLYRIIKYVDDQKELFSLKERYGYVCLLRAQLSDYELGLIFYNCLSDNGCKKFKPLAEKYALFDNLRDKVLNKPMEDRSQYADKAFCFDEEQSEE